MQPFLPNKEYVCKGYSVREISFNDAVNFQIFMASRIG